VTGWHCGSCAHWGGVAAGLAVDLHVAKSEEAATTGSQVARWRWQWGLVNLGRHRVRDHAVERGGSLRTWHVGERLLKSSATLVRKEMKKIKKTYLHCVPANGVAGNGSSGCGG